MQMGEQRSRTRVWHPPTLPGVFPLVTDPCLLFQQRGAFEPTSSQFFLLLFFFNIIFKLFPFLPPYSSHSLPAWSVLSSDQFSLHDCKTSTSKKQQTLSPLVFFSHTFYTSLKESGTALKRWIVPSC